MKASENANPFDFLMRLGATGHAQQRANREHAPMFVFRGPSDSGCMTDCGRPVWFVRNAAEGTPARAELIATIQPEIEDLSPAELKACQDAAARDAVNKALQNRPKP